jgi:hypothetical protein
MQFGRAGTQWRRSGRSFAPGCRPWVPSISREANTSTKDGHGLSGSLTRQAAGVQHPQGELAGARAGVGHNNRFRHISNISHI